MVLDLETHQGLQTVPMALLTQCCRHRRRFHQREYLLAYNSTLIVCRKKELAHLARRKIFSIMESLLPGLGDLVADLAQDDAMGLANLVRFILFHFLVFILIYCS